MAKLRILTVCMGNICRSPMAQGVLAARLREAGLEAHVEVDSAGTYGYHSGEPPDRRAQAAARQRGYAIEDQRARALTVEDFHKFDYVLVMDHENLRKAQSMQPQSAGARLHRFLEFAALNSEEEVPDPYYGGAQGFNHVLDLVEEATDGFLQHLRRHHGL